LGFILGTHSSDVDGDGAKLAVVFGVTHLEKYVKVIKASVEAGRKALCLLIEGYF
jgi:hypothetical protein